MEFNVLPFWAQTALKSGPFFGSEEAAPVVTDPATVTDPPADKPDADKPININPDDHAKLIREKEQTAAQLLALQQEKEEREANDEAALAATRTKEENQSKEIQTLTEDNQKLTLVNTENLLELAILKNNKYDWENPATTVKLVDRAEIKIDAKSGKVEGVDEALKSLAKDHPYLLKAKADNSDANNNDSAGTPVPGQPSGGTPGGSKDASAKANKRKTLEDRFSVLRV